MSHRNERTAASRLVALALVGAFAGAGCDAVSPSAVADAPDRLSAAAPSHAVTRVDVCHRDLSGEHTLITIADAAYDTHVEHGDASPGEAVPGMDGYVFGDQCQPVQAVCPCYQTPLDIGSLFSPYLTYIDTADGWVWELGDFEYARVSYDGEYSCAISTSQTQASYSPIPEPAAEDCIAVLKAYDEIF